jgi:hypothetical protein
MERGLLFLLAELGGIRLAQLRCMDPKGSAAEIRGAPETAAQVDEQNRSALVSLRNAAQQGMAAAQYELGKVYWNGVGVPKDTTEALKCVTLDRIKKAVSAAAYEEAQRRAEEFLKHAH